MPAVPWLNPGGELDLEERMSASNCIFFLGFVATGLTALVATIAIRCAPRGSMSSSPGQLRQPTSFSEKLGNTEPQALTREQRLYQHFPGHPVAMDTNVGQDNGERRNSPENMGGRSMSAQRNLQEPTTMGDAHSGEANLQASSSESLYPTQRLTIATPRFMLPRPPPPPPLTPPELSSSIFNMERRPFSYSATNSDMGSFFEQPNPDYTSDGVASQSTATAPTHSPSTSRRRSYTKSVPVGIPALTPSASLVSEGSDVLSSSFPPTKPFLPGPPPGQDVDIVESPREIDVQGEIISVFDDAGAGWKRHTRVYGGGVCLACIASGGEGHGGFYGVNVRPEDRR